MNLFLLVQFKIEYRSRNNTNMKKDIITTTLVKLVGRPNIVDLNNPEKLIIIEVFKVTSIEFSTNKTNSHEYHPDDVRIKCS